MFAAHNEKYQNQKSSRNEDAVKNAISLTDNSHSRTRSTEYKLVNRSSRIVFDIFTMVSFLFIMVISTRWL